MELSLLDNFLMAASRPLSGRRRDGTPMHSNCHTKAAFHPQGETSATSSHWSAVMDLTCSFVISLTFATTSACSAIKVKPSSMLSSKMMSPSSAHIAGKAPRKNLMPLPAAGGVKHGPPKANARSWSGLKTCSFFIIVCAYAFETSHFTPKGLIFDAKLAKKNIICKLDFAIREKHVIFAKN